MRLLGVNIPDEKKVKISLTYIYGVGHVLSSEILEATKIDGEKRAKTLTPDELNKIKSFIGENYKYEGELRQAVRQNINLMKEIKSYKGVRHMRNLPVRGQRTKTNSRTIRGNVRKTAGSGRRKVELK